MGQADLVGRALLAALGIAYVDAKYLVSWDLHAIKSIIAARLQYDPNVLPI